MTPFVSIDIETTGLDPWECQILEIGAVIDDGQVLESLPSFHCYVDHRLIVGQPYALSMHPPILRRIATGEKGYLYLKPERVAQTFSNWLERYGFHDKVLAAGKNFASFDLQFLNQLPDFRKLVQFKHRFLDPAMLWWKPNVDDGPPNTETCMERAGITGKVAHTAIEDAMVVVKLIRAALTNQKRVPMTFLQQHLRRLQNLLNATAESLNEVAFENESDLIRTDRMLEESFALSNEIADYLLPADAGDIVVVVIHGGKDATREKLDEVLADAREQVIEAGTLAPDEDPCEGCECRATCKPMNQEQEGLEIEENDDDEEDWN